MFKIIAAAALTLGLLTTSASAQDDFFARLFGLTPSQPVNNPALERIQSRVDTIRRHSRHAGKASRTDSAMAEANAYIAMEASSVVPTSYTAGSVHGMAAAIARQHGVPVALVRAVIHVESGGRCSATSHGAIGAMQVKSATARSVGVSGNLRDCRTGITAGVRYLKQALAMNHGNVCAAASSYNTGLGVRGRCSGYGRKVVAAMGRFRVAGL